MDFLSAAMAAQIAGVLNGALSVFKWLDSQGISRARLASLLDASEREGRDITTAEITALIESAEDALDRLDAAIETAIETAIKTAIETAAEDESEGENETIPSPDNATLDNGEAGDPAHSPQT